MREYLIEVENLQVHYPVKRDKLTEPRKVLKAVDGVSFCVRKGETFGIVGESGCGKTTTGKAILKLVKPTAGTIRFNGRDIYGKTSRAEELEFRKKLQIIFQDPFSSLDPRFTVGKTIGEPLEVHKIGTKEERTARIYELMDEVGLKREQFTRFPHEFSGGQRQRIGIARALCLRPELIVCDEPVSALDVSIQAQVLNLLMDMQDQLGLTYLFITHDLSVVKHISDEIAVMYLGVCVERAPKRELFANPLHPYTKALLSAIPAPSLSARGKEFELIRGEVTSALNPPSGCRFAPRCPFCTDACKQAPLELKEHSEGHFVACIRADEL